MSTVNYENILQVFPIWLANLSDLNSVLPLQKELFDLVIIDESSQCDIASVLPAIYRAKKVIVAGDPNQLTHYSFVSKHQQNSKREQYDLPSDKLFDYRNRSALDVFTSRLPQQEQVSFLREHFRSTPSLIEFSNKHFYEGQLEVMKSTPEYTVKNQVELIQVDGTRDKKGINDIEAEAVLAKLDEIIQEYQKGDSVPTLGIISPFRSQVTYINSLLKKKYSLHTIKKFDLLCGTPYNFQGSEREIILLSFSVCSESHHSAFQHASKPEVLNVAITRAKSYQYVFTSVTEKEMPKDSLLASYFSFIINYSHIKADTDDTDAFQNEVVEVLANNQIPNVRCGYPVAGNILDVLVVYGGKNYFIDLVGYPGQFMEAFSMERYKTLSRVGINCLPVHYSYWKNNRDLAIQWILEFIKDGYKRPKP